jgi:hypothetical protein
MVLYPRRWWYSSRPGVFKFRMHTVVTPEETDFCMQFVLIVFCMLISAVFMSVYSFIYLLILTTGCMFAINFNGLSFVRDKLMSLE